MRRRGKSLDFNEDEIEELLDISYANHKDKKRLFCLLTILFPFVNLNNRFHIDHICPASALEPRKLRKEGLEEDLIALLGQQRDMVSNLQLLDRTYNSEKGIL
ncbi:hypothetical protein PT277_09495 [Acetobacteraceae bacterium ESL0709]|nr:hypothetical protein [Acetobacteraceae bacterium ESL0697]MDF7678914.1 hypothetical protein [Acetobacteraceae bacterium ESL0709]